MAGSIEVFGWFDGMLRIASRTIEAAGVGVIILSALFALFRAARVALNPQTAGDAYHEFRQKLGRAILLGLELLVAADIIGTVALEPTLENAFFLAVIVLIRTFLSTSLSVEIEGRWPWSSAPAKQEPRP